MKTKICCKCKKEKKLVDFGFDKNKKDGLRCCCKECRKHESKIYYKKNYKKINKTNTLWKKNNVNKVIESNKKWYKKNYKKVNKKCKKYYKDNIEKVKNKNKLWYKNNPDKTRIKNRKRRNLKNNAQGLHTEQEWLQKKKEYNNRCAYCGVHEKVLKKKYKDKRFWKLTEDHIIPLSKGGTDYIDNIAPACISCNASKNNKLIKQ